MSVAGVIESFPLTDNGIRVSKSRCVLLDGELQCERPVVWDSGRKWS